MREQQMANVQISWQIDRKTEREIIGKMKETARKKDERRISLIYIKKAVSKHYNAEREREGGRNSERI